ncbi:glycosyl hydrolase [Gaoshiqia sp. Z1-71]|uniref:glycosyl hydrolase n=1 Tax=Gaoshiqia hydrogeniformans TaxID=3290090 RepID=UPI003BF8F5A9
MKRFFLLAVLFMARFAVFAVEPINPLATEDVKRVLNYLAGLKGNGILTGQQNLADDVTKWTNKVCELTGEFPALLGEDFSYGHEAFKKRLDIVDAAVEQWKQGGLVTISWHQVNPDTWDGTVNEGDFKDTQKAMTNERFQELLLDSTAIHEKYIAHIDTVATYLKMLRDSGVVVLWRPYHEMNGRWFWWGAKPGFNKLWQMMYDRYTNHHGLNNLIWVWAPNISNPLSMYYPGDDYVDIVGFDGYPDGVRNWDRDDTLKKELDELVALSKNGVVALTEVGWLPDMDWLQTSRPEIVWFLCWWTHLTEKNTDDEIKQVYHHSYAINRGQVKWR